MTEPRPAAKKKPAAKRKRKEVAEPPAVNPLLTATLRADLEALRNDFQQANEMAADFQRQLAGKSNEFAQLKQIFDKSQSDLVQLQGNIEELRAERHMLANEAMRAGAFQVKLARVTEERDRLRMELEVLRKGLAAGSQEMERAVRERDMTIAELVVEAELLKGAIQDAREEIDMLRQRQHAT